MREKEKLRIMGKILRVKEGGRETKVLFVQWSHVP